MDLSEYDCIAKRHRSLTFATYTDRGQNRSSGPSDWAYVIPESVGERIFVILCRNRADEEQINMELASDWFGDGRRSEKKGDIQTATHY
jgi:hypothetical protein